MFKWSKLKNQDPVILFLVSLLTILGLVNVFATTFFTELNPSEDFFQQLFAVVIGISVFCLLSAFNPKILEEPRVQVFLVVITIAALVYLLVSGEVISETRRWIAIGGFRFQPSEFAKITIIISTAAAFAKSKSIKLFTPKNIYERLRKPKKIPTDSEFIRFCLNALAVIAIVILILRQPSLGNAVLALTLWILMLGSMMKNSLSVILFPLVFLLGLNLTTHFTTIPSLFNTPDLTSLVLGFDLLTVIASLIVVLLIIKLGKINSILILAIFGFGIIAGLGVTAVWDNVLSEYQRDRVVAFVNPESDPLGAQWQVTQSKIAIGSGQIFGKGLLQGTQANSGILPFAYTDFAYAAFIEQFGLVGGIALLSIYFALVMRLFTLINKQKENFEKLIIVGVAVMLCLNIIVNVGMNLGIMPVTGVPLPFISYGGSSILVSFIGLGLVQMVVGARPLEKAEVHKFLTRE